MDTSPVPPGAADLALAWSAAALAVWRLTHLLHAEAGPGGVFARLRDLAGTGLAGQALGCFYCLSLWVAAPVAWLLPAGSLGGALGGVPGGLLLWLALSGAAVLLQRLTEPAPLGAPIAAVRADPAAALPWPIAVEDPPRHPGAPTH
ncbi:hypothetical protein [Sphaerotilus microaerophilus]|uniref:DUF1360 domain-containing protein n=1 Tax=Sphaerotilus microaerophilus TaxID=2914710 RepID=A0ABN6PMN7_9BURK|nr:hypothetical protein [Sphaerotilus sp. FB-5]BDI05254.1 hypothetical protein CATMQ487_22240 [Sphaerotilus sp. FB-5]